VVKLFSKTSTDLIKADREIFTVEKTRNPKGDHIYSTTLSGTHKNVTVWSVGDSDCVSSLCAFSGGAVLYLEAVLNLTLNQSKRSQVFLI